MANLVTIDYFKAGQCRINNAESTGWAGTSKSADIASFIARYEPEYLRKLLGNDLYDYMVAHPTEPRIVALIAKLRDDTAKISPIANYIAYKYLAENQVMQTEGGDKESTPSGLTSASNNTKYVQMWNWMVKESISITDWIEENASTYPEYSAGERECDEYEIYQYINFLGI